MAFLRRQDPDRTANPDGLAVECRLDARAAFGVLQDRPGGCGFRFGGETGFRQRTPQGVEQDEVEGVGLGVALTKVSALKTILETEGELFLPIRGLSEDYSFSIRARKHFDLWVDPKIKTGHIAPMIIDERWYKISERKSR